MSFIAKQFSERKNSPKMCSISEYPLPAPTSLVMGSKALPRRDNSQGIVISQLPKALKQMPLPCDDSTTSNTLHVSVSSEFPKSSLVMPPSARTQAEAALSH